MADTLLIPSDQIKSREVVGDLDGDKVVHLAYVGGLNAIVRVSNGHSKPLAFGSHPAVARHLPKKQAPSIKWTSLRKSDHYPLEAFQHLLPRWEAITAQLLARAER